MSTNTLTQPSQLVKSQVKTIDKLIRGGKGRIIVKIRYDDECGNGHNSFAITGSLYDHPTNTSDRHTETCGCIHDSIIKYCPELEPLIKWHFTSSDEPMYYVENTMYHARDTDYNGLKKGEHSAYIVKVVCDADKSDLGLVVYTSGSVYTNKQNNSNLDKSNAKELDLVSIAMKAIKPELNPRTIKEPCGWSISKGKEIDLEAARSCAVWPDATLEQLQDKDALVARLPALMADFKSDMESLGFTY